MNRISQQNERKLIREPEIISQFIETAKTKETTKTTKHKGQRRKQLNRETISMERLSQYFEQCMKRNSVGKGPALWLKGLI